MSKLVERSLVRIPYEFSITWFVALSNVFFSLPLFCFSHYNYSIDPVSLISKANQFLVTFV